MPGRVGERAFQAEGVARTKAVRWEQAQQISGPETRLLYLESNKTPRPGLQELVLDPKGNGRL